MLRPIDQYYLSHDDATRAVLQFMRAHLLQLDDRIKEEWKYSMPMFCIKGKMCCYLWVHKKYQQPYLGIVEGAKINHPDLIQEKRARMKILLIDPSKDIPVKKIDLILKQMLALYSPKVRK